MPYITIGSSSQLQIVVPTKSTTGWDEYLRTNTFTKIAQHDHSGTAGMGTAIATAAIAANAVTGAKIRLDNDEYLRARNAANSADKSILKVNASDEVVFGTTVATIDIQDDGLTIVDNADNTKVIAFNASGITTATTRTLSVPDASGIIVLNDNTATLTNKTLSGNIATNLVSGAATVTLPTTTSTLATLALSETLTNKTLTSPVLNTGVSGTAVLDEDNMASDSATQLATQQSIKAYVDAQVTAQDLDVAGDSGTGSVDLDSQSLTIAGGTGITSSASGQTVTLDIDSTVATLSGSQTLTNKSIDADTNTITNIENADIKAAAAIALNKLAAATASRALVSDASGFIVPATTTSTEIGYVNGVTSSIQNQIDAISASSPLPSIYQQDNLSIACSVGSSALTIALKTQDGGDPTSLDPVKVGFRNATAATGDFSQVSIESALSTVISSGSTAGFVSGDTHYLRVYLINNAGTAELAWSQSVFDEGSIVSTSAEGGAGAADSNATMYSTTARTNVACRQIARLKFSLTTAGTWDEVPDEISLVGPSAIAASEIVAAAYKTSAGQAIVSNNAIDYGTKIYDTHGAVTTGASWVFTVPVAGKYSVHWAGGSNSSTGSVNQGYENYLAKAGTRVYVGQLFTLQTTSAVQMQSNGAATIDCVVGDVLSIQMDNSVTTPGNMVSNDAFNYIMIHKI